MAEVKIENSGTPGKSDDQKFQCPRCGWHESDNPRAPEADLKEYMRCILGDKRFTKTYLLYDGVLQLTFRTLAAWEADMVNSVILKNEYDSPEELADIGRKAKILFYMTKMVREGKIVEYAPPKPVKTEAVGVAGEEGYVPEKVFFDYTKKGITEEYDKRFKGIDETMVRIIFRTFSLFEALQRLLISDGFDTNFWKGAGPF